MSTPTYEQIYTTLKEQDQLHLLAERFALRRNGRSPRTAKQFIQMQLAQDMA